MHDPHSRKSRGFSLVAKKTTREAEAAITALNSTDIIGQIITVEKGERICYMSDIGFNRLGVLGQEYPLQVLRTSIEVMMSPYINSSSLRHFISLYFHSLLVISL